MPRRGDVIADRFELQSEIGSGGMGTVFRARDRQGGGLVAVKVLKDLYGTSLSRFERECSALRELAHGGIVKYLAHGEEPVPYLVMDWIAGATLAQRIDEVGLDLAECVLVGRRIAAALSAAHAAGIVHRDLKPSNVIVRGADLGEAMLIDFGVARQVACPPLTQTGMTVGTPGYMAPEQASGSRALDGRADVFALGCVLYECLTGRPAFCGANQLAVIAKIFVSPPDPIRALCPEIVPPLADLLEAMLAKKPAARPTARDVEAALASLTNLPPGQRRPGHAMLETPTRIDSPHARTQLRCLVLCAPVDERAPEELLERVRADLRARVASFHVLWDGKVICEVLGDDPEAARSAVRFALDLRARLERHVVAVTCAVGAEDAADRGARLIATAAMNAIFSELGGREAVHVDHEVRRRLDPGTQSEHEVVLHP